MAKLTTMTQVKHASEEMEKLFKNGEFKEAAKIGAEILDAFGCIHFIEKEAYKTCFDEMRQYDFYQHVITQARDVVKRFS